MKWIGLTGGIGTGKSTVADILRRRSYQVIDADQIAREALETNSPVFSDVVRVFGPVILDDSGCIQRAKLAEIVFNEPSKKIELENIVHPFVQKKVQELKMLLAKEGAIVAFYDVPLLFEKKLQGQFDKTIVVSCEPEIQLQRIQKRNPQWSAEEINSRVLSQLPLITKVEKADYVIDNNGNLNELESQVEAVLESLKK